jgi:hypothetical protein
MIIPSRPTSGPRRGKSASAFLRVRCNGVLIQQVGKVCAEAHPLGDRVGLLEPGLPASHVFASKTRKPSVCRTDG